LLFNEAKDDIRFIEFIFTNEWSPFVLGSDNTSISELAHVSSPSSFDEAFPLDAPMLKVPSILTYFYL
jgi:hypothetical protein